MFIMNVESGLNSQLSASGKMPVLFIGHGSPLNIILNNSFTEHLVELGKNLPKPKAILVISAHWLTSGTSVTCMDHPKTIHDFYGFPEDLYQIDYPSPGSPDLAAATVDMIKQAGITCNYDWGLDHASWAVLKHMFPMANIPVFEMSLDYSFNEWHPKSLQYHYELAAELGELRTKGVLIIGRGNIVHNLSRINFSHMEAKPFDWAVEFDEKIKAKLTAKNHKALIDYQNLGTSASLAVPSLDHYLPMIYTIALQENDEPLTFTYEGFQNASISMRSFRIG
jgi:4,5-DOPA dioxygenase extradiol